MVTTTTIKAQIIKTPLEGNEQYPVYDPTGDTDRKVTTDDIVARVDAVLIPVKDVNGETGPSVTLDTDNVAEGSTNLYDKVVALTEGTGIDITGTYPNFTITNIATSNASDPTMISGGVISNGEDINYTPDMTSETTPEGIANYTGAPTVSSTYHLWNSGHAAITVAEGLCSFKYEFENLLPTGTYNFTGLWEYLSAGYFANPFTEITYADDTTLTIFDVPGTLTADINADENFIATKQIKSITVEVYRNNLLLANGATIRDFNLVKVNSLSSINVSSVVSRSPDNTTDLNIAAGFLDTTADTDFASGAAQPFVNDIPTMTSNILPAGYIASASSTAGAGFEAFKVFDKTTGVWASQVLVLTGWVKIQIPVVKTYISYFITGRELAELDTNPKDFKLEGSNTGAFAGEEDILDTQVNITNWTDSETKYFNFNNTTDYLYYRLNMTANNGDTNFVSFEEFGLSEVSAFIGNSFFVWADNNSGSQRFIFDDVNGSNLDDVGKAVITGVFTTDANGVIDQVVNDEKSGGAVHTATEDVILDSLTTSYVEIDLGVPVGIPLEVELFILNQIDGSTGVKTYTTAYSDIMPLKTIGGNEATTGVNRGGSDNTMKVRTDNGKIWIKAETTTTSYVASQGYTLERNK